MTIELTYRQILVAMALSIVILLILLGGCVSATQYLEAQPTVLPTSTIAPATPGPYSDCKIVKSLADMITVNASVVECDHHVCVLNNHGGIACWEIER